MKIFNKMIKLISIFVLFLVSNQLIAQTNTDSVQTVCAGSLAEPYLINPPTLGSTYQWTLSAGGTLNNGTTTDNITVDWGVNAGTFTITVIETDSNGCQGAPVTVDVTVIPLDDPTFTLIDYCEGSANSAIVTGTQGGVFTFTNPPSGGETIDASTGEIISGLSGTTYSITYTTLGICPQTSIMSVTVNPLPTATIAISQTACLGSVIPDLSAIGSAVTWYDDAALTIQVGVGNSFATGQTAVGVYTNYVTESLNGCEGPSVPVTLEIYTIPLSPIAVSQTSCFGSVIPDLVAAGNTITWYDDLLLTSQVGIGNNLSIPQASIGMYTYYVTQADANGCESNATIVTLEIYTLPTSPAAINEAACEGSVIPDLTATGTSVGWYSDAALTTLVGNGSPFVTGQTTAGIYTYYATQTDANGCESSATIVTLEIYVLPTAPTATNEVVCEGGLIADLTATGSNLTWYADASLTIVVGSGTTFTTGQTFAGVYTYFVTETNINNCESTATLVTLTINSITIAPLASNQTACFGTAIPDLIATGVGATFTWYSDILLTLVVANNSPFSTGQTAVGSYTYYVTDSQNGCESPATTVTLIIYTTPITGPISHW